MPMIEGWECSTDRIEKYQKMVATDPIGDPIIVSKCALDNDNGLLVVSDAGFGWRIQMGMRQISGGAIRIAGSAGKSKWVRWHDVGDIILKKPNQILIRPKLRKNGVLVLDKKGNYKLKKWKLTLGKSKGEQKADWRKRLDTFHTIIMDIYNRNRVDKGKDPASSDSRM